MNRSMTDTAPARTVRARGFLAQMHRTDRVALAEAIDRENMAELERAAIALRIKQAREELGLHQDEMADALGVHERTYQNYESETKPRTPWALMNEIAKITGKSTEWLIHGERQTPDLVAGLSSGEQVEQGFTEFRGYVGEILSELSAAKLERDAIQALVDSQNANLGTQTGVLETIEASLLRQTEVLAKVETALKDLPVVARALGELLQRLEADDRRRRQAGGGA